MCVKFSQVETLLGEVDRAREILSHGSQFSDPRSTDASASNYWSKWHEFEVNHGNEDTFREMLRVKRSVQLQFTEVSFQAHDVAAAAAAADELAASNNMEQLEMDNAEPEPEPVPEPVAPVMQNPEEIDIDMDDDEDDEEIQRLEVPAAVFGAASEGMGALERLRAKK
eukprot:TRINITY_DN12255_c0_g1_i4.p1 TRINITY_DN12255_c0_g1~~TRINITY_DN12255_c0_g1_i4.p1  ORF type:complete len:168 (+),score=61.37 TRINITY_DN12255_c0_g1_i4:189-692(+)